MTTPADTLNYQYSELDLNSVPPSVGMVVTVTVDGVDFSHTVSHSDVGTGNIGNAVATALQSQIYGSTDVTVGVSAETPTVTSVEPYI